VTEASAAANPLRRADSSVELYLPEGDVFAEPAGSERIPLRYSPPWLDGSKGRHGAAAAASLMHRDVSGRTAAIEARHISTIAVASEFPSRFWVIKTARH